MKLYKNKIFIFLFLKYLRLILMTLGSILQLTTLFIPPAASSTVVPTSTVVPKYSIMPRSEIKEAVRCSSNLEAKITVLSKKQIIQSGIGEIPQIIWRGYITAPATLHIVPPNPGTAYEELRQKFHVQIKSQARWGVNAQETLSEEQSRTLSICAANYFSKTSEERALCGFESHPRKSNDKKVQLFFEDDHFRICLATERTREVGSMKRITPSLMLNLHKDSPPQSLLFYRQMRINKHPNPFFAYRSMLRECEILANMSHPNILPIFHAAIYVNSKGREQVVMGVPCFETSLAKAINAKETRPSFLHTARSLACALLECHRHGIYHADLKPGNIVMNLHSLLTLIDFGNANKNFGTLPYLPLNLVKKAVREELLPDATSDMWSLGCILYILYLIGSESTSGHFSTENPIAESFFSKKTVPHIILPWGELMQVYQRIETALSITKKPVQQVLTGADTEISIAVNKRRENINVNFIKFDVSWVVPKNYASQPHCELLILLQEIDFVLANTLYLANKGYDIGLDYLPKLLVLLETKLKEMQVALETASSPTTTAELAILHKLLQPQKTKRTNAEELSDFLNKIAS